MRFSLHASKIACCRKGVRRALVIGNITYCMDTVFCPVRSVANNLSISPILHILFTCKTKNSLILFWSFKCFVTNKNVATQSIFAFENRNWTQSVYSPNWRDEIPPQAAKKSPRSNNLRSSVQGEWSDTTRSISRDSMAFHKASFF